MKRLLLSLVPLLVLALPSVVFADTLTFNPPDADIDDLDHHEVYTWRVDNVNLNGQTITGARITLLNLSNGDSNPNRLFIHLLDTARFAGVTTFVDNAAGNTAIINDFVDTRHHNNVNWLLAPGTANTHLTDNSFSNTPTTFVYNFTAAELAALAAYIANGGNFALGFDADGNELQILNDGITFEIFTQSAVAPVPEPATMVLLGTGLSTLFYSSRKQRGPRNRD